MELILTEGLVPDGTEYGVPLNKWADAVLEYMEIYCDGEEALMLTVLNYEQNRIDFLAAYTKLVEELAKSLQEVHPGYEIDVDATVEKYAIVIVTGMINLYMKSETTGVMVLRSVGEKHFNEKFGEGKLHFFKRDEA